VLKKQELRSHELKRQVLKKQELKSYELKKQELRKQQVKKEELKKNKGWTDLRLIEQNRWKKTRRKSSQRKRRGSDRI
jgi:hypothetical protein